MSVDSTGSVVITGVYLGGADFGDGPIPTGLQNPSTFLVKRDAAGHTWSKGFGNPATGLAYAPSVQGYAVATDGSANELVGGELIGAVDFGGGPLQSASALAMDAGASATVDVGAGDAGPPGACVGGICSADAFVAKFDPSGHHLWSRVFGAQGSDATRAVAFDAAGNAYVAGAFQDTVQFGGPTLVSAGMGDAWIVKLDPMGHYLWSVRFGGAGDEAAESLAVDSAGNAVVSGVFSGTVAFGATSPTTTAAFDGFVTKLAAADGHVLWATNAKATNRAAIQSVAVGPQDEVVLSGIYEGSIDWCAGPIQAAGGWDAFVVKLDTNGVTTWAKSYGSTGDDFGGPVAIDGAGRIAVAGQVHSPGGVDFGGGPIGGGTDAQLFVLQLDATSGHICSRSYGGPAAAYGVAVDGAGNVVTTRWFEGQVDLGLGPLVSTGGQDIFVGSFAP